MNERFHIRGFYSELLNFILMIIVIIRLLSKMGLYRVLMYITLFQSIGRMNFVIQV